jgi:hypothetical protein
MENFNSTYKQELHNAHICKVESSRISPNHIYEELKDCRNEYLKWKEKFKTRALLLKKSQTEFKEQYDKYKNEFNMIEYNVSKRVEKIYGYSLNDVMCGKFLVSPQYDYKVGEFFYTVHSECGSENPLDMKTLDNEYTLEERKQIYAKITDRFKDMIENAYFAEKYYDCLTIDILRANCDYLYQQIELKRKHKILSLKEELKIVKTFIELDLKFYVLKLVC